MGNTLSSEAPAKAPQKLYKSRVPYHQYDLPTNLTPPPDFAACCEADTRYRHCYLAASRPLLHLNLPSPSHDGAWDSYLSSPVSAAAAHRLSWQRFEAIDCVKLAQLQEPLVTSAADPDASTKSSLKRRLSRANSVVCQTGAGVRSLVRSRSVQSNGYPARDLHQHPAIVMDPHQQSLQSSLLRRRQNSCPIHMTLSALESNPSSQTQDSDSQLSSQGSPARSSFIPVRQRSLYLTPGVATRTVRDSPSSSTKPFVQVGPSIAEAKDSYDSDRRPDFTSLMPSSSGLESQHRPVTPCEANYRQLGGIKFGTLRITNGSPVPSPSAESDDEALRRLAQPPSPTAKDRLVANSPVASVEASEVSTRDSSSTDHAGHGVGKAMPSLPGSPVIDRQLSPRAGTTISQKRSAEVEFTSPEVLDVRDDPHAKSHGIRDKARPSAINQDDSIARSDSGFASASTSSRNSSQRTVSKSDSCFSSSFSIPSIQSEGVIPGQHARGGSNLSSQCTSPKDVEVIMEEPGRVTRWKGSQSTRSAISSMSREVMRRLSSRSSKSLKSLPPDYRQTPVQDGTCWPAGADFVANPEAVQETVFGSPDRKQEKQGRLLRLLSGGRKQANADVYLPSYSVPDCAPAVPVNLREKLHTRIGHMSTVPKKDLFRLDPSHQPLQTILSVESLPLEGDNMEEGNVVDDGNNETWCEAELPREPTPPPPPAKSPRFSPPKVSAASLSPRMLIRRKPVGSGPKTPDKPPKTPAKPLKSPVGRSPLATTDAAAEPPAYQNEGHSLSSHASLPNMTASFRTRPLPPVPPQPSARTVKTARDLLPSQAVSTTSDAQEGRRETLGRYRWMPAQTKNSETVSVSAQPQPRRLGPSATCRPPHLRQYYDDQGQQYRVLHSYNSPSYRNVPIWG